MLISKRQNKRIYTIGLIVGFVVLLCGVALLHQVDKQDEREGAFYLYDVAAQAGALFQRQVTLDLQLLRGVATSMAYLPENAIVPVLQKVNANYEFLYMGMATPDGMAQMLDKDGAQHQANFNGRKFFQEALRGQATFSAFYPSMFGAGMVSYCAVPVGRAGSIQGVLVAVVSSGIFGDMLNITHFESTAQAAIIDSKGAFVLPSGQETTIFTQSRMPDDERRRIEGNLGCGLRGTFTYHVDGEAYVAAFVPLSLEGLFMLCTVPESALTARSHTLVPSVVGVIALTLLLVCFLLWCVHIIDSRHNRELERLAFVDDLTGGANFNRFKLEAQAILRAWPEATFAVWHADIKNFKYYNEMFGYARGDKEIARVASLLETANGPMSCCCRVSADKYAGIRPLVRREHFCGKFEELTEMVKDHGKNPAPAFPLNLHMGVYCTDMLPRGEISLPEMVNRATIALRNAKESNTPACIFYSDEMRGRVLHQLHLEGRMQEALDNEEFVIYFQPKVDIQNGDRIHGAEVLVRWNDGQNFVSPGDFIPLFEQNGFISHLDFYVFERACAWLRSYLGAGHAPTNIAVNVSRLSLVQSNFLESYTEVKNRYAIPDGLLELECTESMALLDARFFTIIEELHKRGFLCSLDDFGAGFSSLHVLKDLPIDVLKLDMLFLRRSRDVVRERIVISNIITLAHELGIRTVSEGVELSEQLEFLRSKGCDMVQGYVFARPMPVDQFEALLAMLKGGPIPLAQPL